MTLTSVGTELENFGEFQRSMKSVLKLNDWHRSSANEWNNEDRRKNLKMKRSKEYHTLEIAIKHSLINL